MTFFTRPHIQICLIFAIPSLAVHADWKDDVGFTALEAELGASLPDGSGVVVTQVEGGTTNYLPNSGNAQFSGKTITDVTGGGSSSGHATSVGQVAYGNTSSVAPGVTVIRGFQAGDWINNALAFAGGGDPLVETGDVANHSWVGETGTNTDDLNILQRLDYQIGRDNYLAVVGVNNRTGNERVLLSNSYNALSVGLTNGNHSFADTTINGAGRSKPDIVSPGLHPVAGSTFTSWATGMVTSAGAMFTEATAGTGAANPETLRALLMAGATKDEFLSWSRTSTDPLDSVFGAGELNVYNSYRIFAGGEHEGSINVQPPTSAPAMGWDYDNGFASPNANTHYYDFDILDNEIGDEFSAILSWNAQVTDTAQNPNVFTPATTLANFNLEFYDSSISFLGSKINESVSSVDNVEHIYLTDLDTGTYTLAVTSDTDWDFGLAWRLETSPIPEPSTIIFLLASGLVFTRRYR